MTKAIDACKLPSLGYAVMEIIINGSVRDVPAGYTAEKLVEAMALTGKRIAMEVNKEIVPRSRYSQLTFEAGDQIEIVHAVGGG